MSAVLEITILTLALSLVISVIYRFLTDPAAIRNLKQEMKIIQEKANKAQKEGDTKKAGELTSEMLKLSQKQLGMSMKPMMFSFIVVAAAFYWLGTQYAEVMINAPFTIPFLGAQLNWFWWYILLTIPATWVFRKLLGVE